MNGKENKLSESTPEELLRMLDLRMQNMRSKRDSQKNVNAIRAFSVLLMLLIVGGALAVLMYLMEDLQERRAAERNLDKRPVFEKVSQ